MAAKAGSVYEGVMGLNETNAKFAKWIFRVLAEMVMPPHPLTPKSPYHPKGGLIGMYSII